MALSNPGILLFSMKLLINAGLISVLASTFLLTIIPESIRLRFRLWPSI